MNNTAQTTLSNFYVVQPRTLHDVSDEVEAIFTIDEQQLIFEIHVKKPQAYVFKSQENDNDFTNEHIRIYIAPNADARAVFVFAVNHQKSFFDGIYTEQSGLSTDWNGQWDYEVERNDSYWKVTGSIGWKNFLFNATAETQTIRVGFAKYGNDAQRVLSSVPSHIGHTGFVQALQQINIGVENQSLLEVFPYYSLNHSLLDNNEIQNVGGEVFWQANQHLSVDLSINPDFGQIELNELVVNFSAIEVFFSEQRPFFTHNQSLYDVVGPENLLLVHTPRIGGSSAFEDINSRQITAAARLNYASGQLSHSLLFASENDNDDIRGRDFIAFRSKLNAEHSTWGISANIVDTPSLARRSSVFGIDYFSTISDTFNISIGLVGSVIDATKDTSDIGGWLQSSFEINNTHLHDLTFFVYGNELEINDFGFVQRVDRKQVEYEYTYLLPTTSIGFIEQMTIAAEVEVKTNFANEMLPNQIGLSSEFVAINDALFEIGFEVQTAGKDDLLTRQYNSTNLDSSWVFETVYESPELDFGQLSFEFNYGIENWSGRFFESAISMETELLHNVFAQATVSEYRSNSWLNWEGVNVVNEYEFAESAIDLRLNYRFSEYQEIRLRFELVAGDGIAKSGNSIDKNGERLMLERPNDFSFSEAAFQIRYKYSLSKLSAVFLSYTFGGEFEEDIIGNSRRGLYSRAIANKNEHGLFFKARLQF
ncbi:MAG: DUF5916 domain-containing protein [Glaciecola sp.]